ncbi:hypothetical protein FALCPG4_007738 [Fusarium falciforme]
MATRLIIEQGLKKAIEDTCMAVEATTAQSPERATMMIHLGDRLNTRHTFRGDPSDFEEASSYWPSAMGFENAPIRIRLIAADQCLPAANLLEDLKKVYQIAHAGGVPQRVEVGWGPKLSQEAISERENGLESFEALEMLEWLWDAIACPVLEDVSFL